LNDRPDVQLNGNHWLLGPEFEKIIGDHQLRHRDLKDNPAPADQVPAAGAGSGQFVPAIFPLPGGGEMTDDTGDIFRIMCPNLGCQRILAVPPRALGLIVRCRGCGTNIRIPHPKSPEPMVHSANEDQQKAAS
jgi:hypothetical protein